MTIGDRIKELRKSNGLTQQEFSDRIGIKRNTLAQYENNRNQPIDAVINLICKEFGINETWLRTGEGDMYTTSQDTLLGDLITQFQLDDFDQQLVMEYMKLSKDKRAVFKEYLERVTGGKDDHPEVDSDELKILENDHATFQDFTKTHMIYDSGNAEFEPDSENADTDLSDIS